MHLSTCPPSGNVTDTTRARMQLLLTSMVLWPTGPFVSLGVHSCALVYSYILQYDRCAWARIHPFLTPFRPTTADTADRTVEKPRGVA